MRVVFAAAALLILGTVGATAGTSGAAGVAPAAATAAPLRPAAAETGVVAATAMSLMFARHIAITAVEKAPTANLKKLSFELATAYTATLAEWKQAASAAGLATQLPSVLDLEHADKAELLLSSFGTQFEHEYLDFQIAAHAAGIERLSRIDGKGPHAAMRPAAARVLAQMTASLDGLRDAKRRLPAM